MPEGVVRPAAIAKRQVEVSIRSESKHPAVVVRGRLIGLEQNLAAFRIGSIRIGRNHVGRENRVATVIRVVHEESAVVCKGRIESEAQQALLTFVANLIGNVEEGIHQ